MRDITPPHLACTTGFSCTRVIEDGDDLIVIAKRVHPQTIPYPVDASEEAVRIAKAYFPQMLPFRDPYLDPPPAPEITWTSEGSSPSRDHLEAFRKCVKEDLL